MANGMFPAMTKEEVMEQAERAKKRLDKMKEKAEETMSVAMEAFVATGTAFGFGYLRGRMTDEADPDSFTILGISPDLLVGAAGHVLAFAGVAGKWSGIMHAGANGALASFATFSGLEFGVKDRDEDPELAAEGKGLRIGTAGVPQALGRRNPQAGAQRMPGVGIAQQMATAAAASRAGA